MLRSFFEKLGKKRVQGTPWRIEAMPPEVQIKRRAAYKAAGKIARLVVEVRNLTVPREEWEAKPTRENVDTSLHHVASSAKRFLDACNAWRKEEVRFFQPSQVYSNLASHVEDKVRKAERHGADAATVAREKACWHACVAINKAHKAVLALIRKHDSSEALAAAIEAAAHTAYYAKLRDGQGANLGKILTEFKTRFAI